MQLFPILVNYAAEWQMEFRTNYCQVIVGRILQHCAEGAWIGLCMDKKERMKHGCKHAENHLSVCEASEETTILPLSVWKFENCLKTIIF